MSGGTEALKKAAPQIVLHRERRSTKEVTFARRPLMTEPAGGLTGSGSPTGYIHATKGPVSPFAA
jgi:hypothetical protein